MVKIGILGAGAIGLLIGKPLADKYGHENVFYIADEERAKKYRKQGFAINGEEFYPLVRTPKEHTTVDLLVFAVKAVALKDAMIEGDPFRSENTRILSLMNGISSERTIAEGYGIDPLLLAVGQEMDATKKGRSLAYQRPGNFSMGEIDGSQSERLRWMREIFEGAGIDINSPEDMNHHLWSKFMLNCGINQVLAVHRKTYGAAQRGGPLHDEFVAAMEEVRQLGIAEGVKLTQRDIDFWVAVIDRINPEGMPSMAQDVMNGRPTEVELFAGTAIQLGEKHGIPTPMNQHMYDELKELEKSR